MRRRTVAGAWLLALTGCLPTPTSLLGKTCESDAECRDLVCVQGTCAVDPAKANGGDGGERCDPPCYRTLQLTAGPDMSAPRVHAVATRLQSGEILISGGSTAGGAALATSEIFDPVTSRFEATAPMASARRQHTATLLKDGRVLVAGGEYAQNNPLDTAELFDPISRTWSSTGSMSTPRSDHLAALLVDGRVVVSSGNDAVGPRCEVFDPESGTWTTIAPSASHNSAAAVNLPDGRPIFVSASAVETFDPVAGWTSLAAGLTSRINHVALVLDERTLFVAGGSNTTSGVLAVVELVNVETGQITRLASMSSARADFGMVKLPDGRILAVGGHRGDSPREVLASAELYVPGEDTWHAAPALTAPRENFILQLLPDGRVLAAGGAPGPYASTEVYVPQ